MLSGAVLVNNHSELGMQYPISTSENYKFLPITETQAFEQTVGHSVRCITIANVSFWNVSCTLCYLWLEYLRA